MLNTSQLYEKSLEQITNLPKKYDDYVKLIYTPPDGVIEVINLINRLELGEDVYIFGKKLNIEDITERVISQNEPINVSVEKLNKIFEINDPNITQIKELMTELKDLSNLLLFSPSDIVEINGGKYKKKRKKHTKRHTKKKKNKKSVSKRYKKGGAALGNVNVTRIEHALSFDSSLRMSSETSMAISVITVQLFIMLLLGLVHLTFKGKIKKNVTDILSRFSRLLYLFLALIIITEQSISMLKFIADGTKAQLIKSSVKGTMVGWLPGGIISTVGPAISSVIETGEEVFSFFERIYKTITFTAKDVDELSRSLFIRSHTSRKLVFDTCNDLFSKVNSKGRDTDTINNICDKFTDGVFMVDNTNLERKDKELVVYNMFHNLFMTYTNYIEKPTLEVLSLPSWLEKMFEKSKSELSVTNTVYNTEYFEKLVEISKYNLDGISFNPGVREQLEKAYIHFAGLFVKPSISTNVISSLWHSIIDKDFVRNELRDAVKCILNFSELKPKKEEFNTIIPYIQGITKSNSPYLNVYQMLSNTWYYSGLCKTQSSFDLFEKYDVIIREVRANTEERKYLTATMMEFLSWGSAGFGKVSSSQDKYLATALALSRDTTKNIFKHLFGFSKVSNGAITRLVLPPPSRLNPMDDFKDFLNTVLPVIEFSLNHVNEMNKINDLYITDMIENTQVIMNDCKSLINIVNKKYKEYASKKSVLSLTDHCSNIGSIINEEKLSMSRNSIKTILKEITDKVDTDTSIAKDDKEKIKLSLISAHTDIVNEQYGLMITEYMSDSASEWGYLEMYKMLHLLNGITSQSSIKIQQKIMDDMIMANSINYCIKYEIKQNPHRFEDSLIRKAMNNNLTKRMYRFDQTIEFDSIAKKYGDANLLQIVPPKNLEAFMSEHCIFIKKNSDSRYSVWFIGIITVHIESIPTFTFCLLTICITYRFNSDEYSKFDGYES